MSYAGTTTSSLVVTPAVVAHRGASGYRPEHTLDAYRMAIRMGADDIELDLVISADGVLVARHESELSETTDVARLAEFADRRTTRMVDGQSREGWFVEDFTVAELKHLTARERYADLRVGSATYDQVFGIPTFNEVLAMVAAESVRCRRSVGVMVELKHAADYDSIGLPLDTALLDDLRRHGLDHPRSRVSVMSLETGVLRRLADRTTIPIIQLLGPGDARPPDLSRDGDPRTYADLATRDGLRWIDEYADGIGAHASLVLPPDGLGRVGGPSTLVRDAHREWLTVHVWTLRAEARFLPTDVGDLPSYAQMLLAAGVDGLITDHPDQLLGLVGAGVEQPDRPDQPNRTEPPASSVNGRWRDVHLHH